MSKRGHGAPNFDYFSTPQLTISPELGPASSAGITVIADTLTPLKPDSIYGERNWFVSKFEWIPYSKREMTIALQGLGLVLMRAGNATVNRERSDVEKLKPVARTYNQVRGWWEDSKHALTSLHDALPEEAEKILPSPERIRSNEEIKKIMVDFIIARSSLDSQLWNSRKIISSARQQWRERIQAADEADLAMVWAITRVNHKRRMHHWTEQIQSVRENEYVVRAASLPDGEIRLI